MTWSLGKMAFVHFLVLFAYSATGFADLGDIFNGGGSFGTKFACCRSESVSCTGGGGATVYTRTLKDRSLTQVDATARCVALGSKMRWNTESCLPDTSCGSSSGGNVPPPPPPPPPPVTYTFNFDNDQSQSIYLAVWKAHQTIWETRAWYEVLPNQRRSFTYDDIICVAAVRAGVDLIYKARTTPGHVLMADLMTLRVNPTRKTDLFYGTNGEDKLWVNIAVDGVMEQRSYSSVSGDGFHSILDDAGFKTLDCFLGNKTHVHAGLQ